MFSVAVRRSQASIDDSCPVGTTAAAVPTAGGILLGVFTRHSMVGFSTSWLVLCFLCIVWNFRLLFSSGVIFAGKGLPVYFFDRTEGRMRNISNKIVVPVLAMLGICVWWVVFTVFLRCALPANWRTGEPLLHFPSFHPILAWAQ